MPCLFRCVGLSCWLGDIFIALLLIHSEFEVHPEHNEEGIKR